MNITSIEAYFCYQEYLKKIYLDLNEYSISNKHSDIHYILFLCWLMVPVSQ